MLGGILTEPEPAAMDRYDDGNSLAVAGELLLPGLVAPLEKLHI